jgi:hypothetical protein
MPVTHSPRQHSTTISIQPLFLFTRCTKLFRARQWAQDSLCNRHQNSHSCPKKKLGLTLFVEGPAGADTADANIPTRHAAISPSGHVIPAASILSTQAKRLRSLAPPVPHAAGKKTPFICRCSTDSTEPRAAVSTFKSAVFLITGQSRLATS